MERKLKKLIQGGLHLLCKEGSLGFCKMRLEDRSRGWLQTVVGDGPPTRGRSVRRICVSQYRKGLADAGKPESAPTGVRTQKTISGGIQKQSELNQGNTVIPYVLFFTATLQPNCRHLDKHHFQAQGKNDEGCVQSILRSILK